MSRIFMRVLFCFYMCLSGKTCFLLTFCIQYVSRDSRIFHRPSLRPQIRDSRGAYLSFWQYDIRLVTEACGGTPRGLLWAGKPGRCLPRRGHFHVFSIVPLQGFLPPSSPKYVFQHFCYNNLDFIPCFYEFVIPLVVKRMCIVHLSKKY